VASITSSGAKSGFSNYGATSVDLGAPGSGIYSTLPDNTYGSYSGTSMATPHVSGAAALYGSVNGSATAEQTKKWILDNTIPTSSLNGRTVTGGRLNLGALAAPTAPLAPSNLSAAASSGQVTLTWIDNSGNEEGFKVERSLDGTLFTELAPTAGPNATSYSDTAVQPLTTYHYRVRAFNAVGPSEYSNTTTTTTPGAPVPPASPSELVATASSSSEVSLTWKDNSADEDGFKIERCQGVGCTSFAEIGQVGFSSTTNVSYKDTTVTGGTFYRYQVRAYNAGGSSGYSNIAEATTPAPPTAPAAPSELKLTVASSSRIDLAWKDNSGNETGFKIERSTNGTSFTQITSLGPDVTSYSNTSLSSGTRYYYRVRANNTAGNSGYSNTASAATSKPSAPSNLTASAISSNQINLAWSDKSDNETGFKIYRSTDGSNFTQIATVDRNVTTYSSTGLSPNKKYYYRVRAYNGVGNSSNSNSANATTKAS
jgi:titin